MTMKAALPLSLSFLLCWSSIASAFVDPPRTSFSPRLAARSRTDESLRMVADDDDDENNPLSRGIDSVSWLPSVVGPAPSRSVFDAAAAAEAGKEEEEGTTETLPLFPLGGIVYTPNSEHTLNIFEPRYRQMYNDILMNGSKRFAVSMCHPSEEGRFAQMGVVFSLEELKEVSEMTADRVKYICNHRVTGRVRLHAVVNPEAWESRETYLKVRGTIIDDTGELTDDDSDDDEDEDKEEGAKMDENISQKLMSTLKRALRTDAVETAPEEEALAQSFSELVELQHDLSEDVRFTRASIKSFGVAAGTEADPNLWTSIRLWQSYAEQRLVAGQNDMQKEFQERLVEYLKTSLRKEDGGAPGEDLPSAIGFQDLSPALQAELVDLQKRMTAELKPLLLEQTLSMQKILEAAGHAERVELMRYFVDAERKRLAAKRMLKGLFRGEAAAVSAEENGEGAGGDGGAAAAPTAPSTATPAAPTPTPEGGANESQLFADDEDAFQ